MGSFDIGNANVALNQHLAIGKPQGTQRAVSGQYLPFPELSEKLAGSYADSIGGFLGGLNSGGGTGGASDFSSYFTNVGGPPANFTDIKQGGVYTPQQVNEGVNAIWAQNDARAGNQNRLINQQLGPGMAPSSGLLAELQQNNLGRYAAIGADQAREFGQNAALVNAQHALARAGAQTNVESLRAGSDQNKRQLALQARGQDFNREQSLLASLLSGGGGLFGPLDYSEQTHTYGPALGQYTR